MAVKGLVVAVVALLSVAALCRAQVEEKRAQMGFMGMRGKKDDLRYVEEKRAPMGFNGMRGKKSSDLEEVDPEPPLYSKRAPQMGFMGMRGKKDYLWDIDEDKRAQAGFFGMRGKKGPSGFFGMRGKKGPSGFFGMRGKKGPSGFMGVRGKKDQGHEEIENLIQLLQDSAVNNIDNDEMDARLSRFADFSSELEAKSQLH